MAVDKHLFFQPLLNSISARTVIIREDGVIVAGNAAWRDFLESHLPDLPRESTGLNYFEICEMANRMSSACAQEAVSGIRQVIARSSDSFEFEYQPLGSDLECWCRLHAALLADVEPAYTLLTHEDINDTGRTIDRLKTAVENQKRTARILSERLPMLILYLVDDVITEVNETGAAILGVQAPEQAVGKSIHSFLQPGSNQQLVNDLSGGLEKYAIHPFVEYPVHFSDGRIRDMEISLIIDDPDRQGGLQIIGIDITERKQIQEALIRQAVLAEIGLNISQPLELQKALDRAIDIAKRSISGSGWAALTLLDHKTGSFWVPSLDVSGEAQRDVRLQITDPEGISRRIMEGGEILVASNTVQVAVRTTPSLVQYGIHSFVGVPLRIENDVLGVLYVFESKPYPYSEKDLDFLGALASRIALGITKVRLYETLLEARVAAEDTARVKSEFLANMSHELRTPLTAVVIVADLLRDTELDSEQTNYVDSISISAEKVLSMINDILDFSKIEAEKLKLDQLPFDLIQCIEDALDIVAPQAAEKGLDLVYQLSDNTPTNLIGDTMRLGQVIINLLSNSVKFTDQGEVFLTVRAEAKIDPPEGEKTAPDGGTTPLDGGTTPLDSGTTPPEGGTTTRLTFEIRDTGIGILPEKIENLFGVFSQLDSSITRKYGGTGLGLAICKHLVTLMEGDIWVESRGMPGEGSTFFFTIESTTSPADLHPFLSADHPDLAGKKALILCGYNRTRQVLEDKLRLWGLRADGFSGLDPLSAIWTPAGIPDIVLFGSRTAKTEVERVLCELFPRQDFDDLKWIQIKAPGLHSNPGESIGMDAYLDTPIKPGQVFDVLMKVFRDPGDPESGSSGDKDLKEPKGFRILLAEDDPTNQILIALLLEKMGYRVETAASGLEVLQIMEQECFDVIIMDLQMPEMDGLTATRYIREILPKDDQPFIIALTADSRRETMQESILDGVDLFLTKPMRKKVLQQVLNDLETQKEIQTELTRELAPPVSGGAPIDDRVLSDLLNTFKDAPGGVTQLLESFSSNAPKTLEALKQSLQVRDWDQVMVKAHALKGSCELFGAARLAELCRTAENLVRNGNLDGMTAQVMEIENEYDRVKLALERKLTSQDSQPG